MLSIRFKREATSKWPFSHDTMKLCYGSAVRIDDYQFESNSREGQTKSVNRNGRKRILFSRGNLGNSSRLLPVLPHYGLPDATVGREESSLFDVSQRLSDIEESARSGRDRNVTKQESCVTWLIPATLESCSPNASAAA
jgi:hypothetical protein